jgi:hypothetical protein
MQDFPEQLKRFLRPVGSQALPGWVLPNANEPRWLVPAGRKRLGNAIKFAPPSNLIPKIALGLFSMLDRLSDFAGLTAATKVLIGESFLAECAELIKIPLDRVGICFGRDLKTQKLIVFDLAGNSPAILKIASGPLAGELIAREANGLILASKDNWWQNFAPKLIGKFTIGGRPALLIERFFGSTLAAKNMETLYKMVDQRTYSVKMTIEDWWQSLKLPTSNQVEKAYENCCKSGAINLVSPIGLVQGDFSTWNAIMVGKTIKIIDWEYSMENTPLIFDQAYCLWARSNLLKCSRPRWISKTHYNSILGLGYFWLKLRDLITTKRGITFCVKL